MSEQNNNPWAKEYSKEATNAIQEDLQAQLRQFGASVVDGVNSGFADGGEEIGKRAADVGNAFLGAAAKEYQTITKNQWAQRLRKKPSAAFEKMTSARNTAGVLQVVFGAVFGLPCLLAALICILVGALASGVAGVATLMAGIGLAAVGVPLSFMFLLGLSNLKFSKRLKRYLLCFADRASVSIAAIVEETGYDRAVIVKDMRKIMKNDWCPLWLEERTNALYLTVESYREAKDAQQVQATQTRVKNATGEGELLDSIANFINVLGKQTEIMEEAVAIAELKRMQETCRDIYDWLKIHPEAAPRMRRFTSYYMPTTLKLLFSYNDVKGQQGENAQNIRRDIGRFLHTLNTAFDNLHDSLLSSVSLDVSSEIAALQGMLAQDGLSQTDDFAPELKFD